MPRKRRAGILRTGALTPFQEMELFFGPDGESAFANPILQRAAWFHHRSAFMEEHGIPGSLCWGWWALQSSCKPPFPSGQDEARELERLGVLDADELAEVRAIQRILTGNDNNQRPDQKEKKHEHSNPSQNS